MHYLLSLVVLPFIAANAIVIQLRLEKYFGTGRRARRLPKGLCPECDCDLRDNTSGVCPECGTDLPESNGEIDRDPD